MMQRVLLLLALVAAALPAQPTLPGAQPLTTSEDLSLAMVDGIHRYLDAELPRVVERRKRMWDEKRGGDAFLEARRSQLRKIIGAVDSRAPRAELQFDAAFAEPAELRKGDGYTVFRARWPVFDGVSGEGLVLWPTGRPVARMVVVPEADMTPEALAGLAPGVRPEAQLARRLAENGCLVVVPVLIDRRDTWSGIAAIRMTNQPHREFLYRMAYQVGRHVIGYEVQKVLAVVDWFAQQNSNHRAPVAVAGYGEGGLTAFYSAALDSRIDAALVGGYFQPRENLWQEPIYRNVWGLTRDFGDAEIAALIAPRALIIDPSGAPEVAGPPPETKDRRGATPNGRLAAAGAAAVRAEVERARRFFAARSAGGKLQLLDSSTAAPAALLTVLGIQTPLRAGQPPKPLEAFDSAPRLERQFRQLVEHAQLLVRQSPARRAAFWSKADSSSPERWRETTQFYRDYFWDEVLGRLPPPSVPANPRARLIFDEPRFRGYEVLLDVWPDVIAYGILLVPKDIRPGERRPVVVTQHGLEGRPRDVADPAVDHRAYHKYGVQLAEEGFIAYAPQNPYIGEERFRLILRKAHPLKLSLFSFITGQHQRTLEWLSSLPFADPGRIGFYGLSYGGKTAVRVPPLLDGYALSICSADFNEWVWKTTSVDAPHTYMITREYDMLEFDFANVVNYAELASLMAPRPFMVERGHRDGVAPDEWVAYEYAKVRRFYATLRLADRTDIEFFDGPHTINGVGTFAFLRRHLRWPVP